jgi:predicted membrane channel-forming protein YqfA (hemolysin III family)
VGDKLKRLLYLGMHMDHTHLSYKDRLSNIISWFGLLSLIIVLFSLVFVIFFILMNEYKIAFVYTVTALIVLIPATLFHITNYLINGRFKFLPWKPTK